MIGADGRVWRGGENENELLVDAETSEQAQWFKKL
jgi:hypothetical protein